jgi:anti-sigma regulatory factor (Ser/Thr protein kinase)
MEPESKFAAGKMQIELRCRIDASMLRLLRDLISSVSSHLGFSDQQIGEIEICVDEACANALEHAYQGTDDQPVNPPEKVICIEICFDGEALTVRVIDSGQGLATAMEMPVESIDKYAQPGREKYRGLGFFLMHKFMDRVDVRTSPGQGTTVEMIKLRK